MLNDLVIYLIYLLVFLWLIFRNGLFGIFKDDKIPTKMYGFVFFIKSLSVPTFYFVYKKLYGGIDNLDAGKFYHDVRVIHDFALKDFYFYLKLMFGLQNDFPNSYDFEQCLKYTVNWDNGTIKDYLYNDNRILIRTHSLIDFIAFHSYFAHALFSCLLSFIGLQFIYKTFKQFFNEKETILFLILCFVPALWFYTGAMLKEGITVFCLGWAIHASNQFAKNKNIKNLILLLPILFICSLLKPYLLLFTFFCCLLFFNIQYASRISKKILVFFSIVIGTFFLVNLLSVSLKQRSLLEAALKHQRLFAGVAKGGIFLADKGHFFRLKNDSTQIKKIQNKPNFVTIKKNVAYMFWKNNHELDTLFCKSNRDTLTQYELLYTISESKSNIEISDYHGGAIVMIASSYYYSLFFPFFVNAKGLFQLLASVENLLVLISLLFIFYSLLKNKKNKFFPVFLVFVCLAICFLVGLATPNSGAIFRYRSPVISFIFLAAFYFIAPFKLKFTKHGR